MDYKTLVMTYSLLEKTSKRLEKTDLIAKLLKRTPTTDLNTILLLLRGSVYPSVSEEKLGVADKLVIKAINVASGHTIESINKLWKQTGDLGDVAAKLAEKKTQRTLFAKKLTTKKVFNNLRKLAEMSGAGSTDQKIQLIAELLGGASPMEAKYIVRTTLGELRVGVAAGTLRDAIVWAFLDPPGEYDESTNKYEVTGDERDEYSALQAMTQKAVDLMNDFGKVAELAKEKGAKGLGKVELAVGVPLKLMLCQKAEDVEDAFQRVGKPAAFEFKYDGFRLQVHRKGDKISLFTRRLENVTKAFPDIVKAVKTNTHGKEFILDCEAVGYDPKTKGYLPFQMVSQRIRRKHNIEAMAKQFPVELCVFDVLFYEGESMLHEKQKDRRKVLTKIVKDKQYAITKSNLLITDKVGEATKFFKKAKSESQEGLIAKNLDSQYHPGSRVGFQVKIKGALDTLDLVIVGAEWGEGKRSGWLTSFTLAVRDGSKFKTCGKVGTGMKEKTDIGGVSFTEMTKTLKPLIVEEHGRKVKIKPKVVVEILCEEIQKSPTYEAGYALRFPRVINLRHDKPRSEANTLDDLKREYKKQSK